MNQNDGKIYKVSSGEAGTPGGCSIDIPWLSADPTSGTVPPSAGNGATNPFPITLTFDAGSMLPGLQQAQLAFSTQTPHAVPNVPVTLTVRFLDVADENQFEAYIYGVAGAGVMFGGPPVCAPGVLYFCPDGNVTRADMAGYLWRAINGRNTPPPVYQNIFNDVTFNDYNSFYIQGIYDLGVTAGCDDGTKYCPNVPVTRAQMSALVWRGQHGDEAPPACAGVFDDVPCPSLLRGLHRGPLQRGCGRGLRKQQLLPAPADQQRSDGGLPGQGLRHPGASASASASAAEAVRHSSHRSRARLTPRPFFLGRI